MARRGPSIPLGADSGLLAAARRTTFVRVVLALGLVALLAAEVALARGVSPRHDAFVASGTSTVVVIDLSQSIPHGAFPTVGRVLRSLAKSNVPVGLVIFSDTAYELLPPGTPGRELRPLLRYFTPLPGTHPATVWDAEFPDNPWSLSFRGGTHVSGALALARAMLLRDRIARGSILLLSDLEIPAQDVPPLTTVLAQIKRDAIPLRVVGLFPSSGASALFRRLAGDAAFRAQRDAVVSSRLTRQPPPPGPPVPVALIAIAAVLLVVLAWNEGWLARLPVPRTRGEAAA